MANKIGFKPLEKDEQRHMKLAWKIIEAKIMYYQPRMLDEQYINANMPPDAGYDAMEKEYLGLCLKLNYPNTVVHKGHPGFEKVKGDGMMEVDYERFAVKTAYDKLYHDSFRPEGWTREAWYETRYASA